jgi:agmatinase
VTILQIDAHIDWRDEVQGERLGLSSTMRRSSEMGMSSGSCRSASAASARPRVQITRMRWRGVTFVPAGEVARDGIGAALDG